MLLVRPAVPDDVPAMLAVYAEYIGTPVTFETSLPSEGEFLSRLESVTETYPWLVCEDSGTVLGYAYAHRLSEREAYSWAAETSVYVKAGTRGKGVGRALYTELLDILEGMGVRRAMACVTVPNQESEGFHASMGFRQVGRFENAGYKDGWRDVAWLQRDLGGSDAPGPLRPWRNPVP
ncbi:MAG: GNAT family N-acetyltransferase [Thermoplasmata archaeon]|nr:GNAT family N-acetyltransferase [Thermoplasmata archaeon]